MIKGQPDGLHGDLFESSPISKHIGRSTRYDAVSMYIPSTQLGPVKIRGARWGLVGQRIMKCRVAMPLNWDQGAADQTRHPVSFLIILTVLWENMRNICIEVEGLLG